MQCSKPVIAAVNGPALGAGMALALCCDIILASDDAVFGMPEVDVGLAGGVKFLQRYFTPSQARMLLITGRRVSAAELYRLGVLQACVPGPEPDAGGDGARARDRGEEPARGADAQAVVQRRREPVARATATGSSRT